MWYKNAVIYSLDVETFMDSNGDGVGDFRGLTDRLDHLETMGVTCVWLQPFHPSPNLDDGYDVADYYGVDPRLGSLGDFAEFSHQLSQRGIRLFMDLVVNHTSDQHPWFQAACRDRDSPFRDYYVWSATKPPGADQGMVFPGPQKTTWTWNEQAGAFYFHRFYAHQPDLNIANPAVRDEILRILSFWLKLGVSGFRIDAAPFLIELTGHDQPKDEAMVGFLGEMHQRVAWRSVDAVLLAEANVSCEKIGDYVGDGDRMHMLVNFLVNQPLFLALAQQRAEPLETALRRLPPLPPQCQWAQFLRLHDELDLGRLSQEQLHQVFDIFAPDPDMRLYGRGIRRRLAPMLGNDRRRIALAHSLLLSLPGAHVVRYGDEIGMGDDLSLEQRLSVRTPMQWSDAAQGGFTTAGTAIRPVIDSGPCGYPRVNVRSQLADETSLLNCVARLIRLRRACPEIGWGELSLLPGGAPEVLAHRLDWRDRGLLAVHNLGSQPRRLELVAVGPLEIEGYGFRWYRIDGTSILAASSAPAPR